MSRDSAVRGPCGPVQVIEAGTGDPVVVLLTGLGVSATTWWQDRAVLDAAADSPAMPPGSEGPFLGTDLARDFRVISYERAGLGGSSAPTAPRRLRSFAEELDRIIELTADRPHIVVAHSLGGVVALDYAKRASRGLAGLVLLDSSHPNQLATLERDYTQDEARAADEERQRYAAEHVERPDRRSLNGQGDRALSEGCLRDLPLLVLSRDPDRPGLTDGERRQEARWSELQRALAAASRESSLVRIARSGHDVHLDAADQVVGLIHDFIRSRRHAV